MNNQIILKDPTIFKYLKKREEYFLLIKELFEYRKQIAESTNIIAEIDIGHIKLLLLKIDECAEYNEKLLKKYDVELERIIYENSKVIQAGDLCAAETDIIAEQNKKIKKLTALCNQKEAEIAKCRRFFEAYPAQLAGSEYSIQPTDNLS